MLWGHFTRTIRGILGAYCERYVMHNGSIIGAIWCRIELIPEVYYKDSRGQGVKLVVIIIFKFRHAIDISFKKYLKRSQIDWF